MKEPIHVINESTKYNFGWGKLIAPKENLSDELILLKVKVKDTPQKKPSPLYVLFKNIAQWFRGAPLYTANEIESVQLHPDELEISPPGTISNHQTVYRILPRGSGEFNDPHFAGNKLRFNLLHKSDQIKELKQIVKLQQGISERSRHILLKIKGSISDKDIAREIAETLTQMQQHKGGSTGKKEQ